MKFSNTWLAQGFSFPKTNGKWRAMNGALIFLTIRQSLSQWAVTSRLPSRNAYTIRDRQADVLERRLTTTPNSIISQKAQILWERGKTEWMLNPCLAFKGLTQRHCKVPPYTTLHYITINTHYITLNAAVLKSANKGHQAVCNDQSSHRRFIFE